MSDKELTTEEWKQKKKENKARFTAMQRLPYEVKVQRAKIRAYEFVREMDKRGCNTHVSVGGLDSITLLVFLRHIGLKDIPAIGVGNIEDKSIQRIHKQLGVINIKSYKSKVEVINEVGFPVISKRIAGKIDMLQHPSEKNKTVRHAIITGECGEQGHFAKDSRMKLPNKWLKLFAGMANEEYGTHYKTAPFPVSNKCCYYLKEKPCDDWAKEHNSFPFLGIMASEGGQREEALVDHGCNYYGKTVSRSAPFAPFMRQDLLQLALDLDVPIPEITARSKESQMELYIPPRHNVPDAPCVVSGSTWKNVHTGSTDSGKQTQRNGSFGCINVTQTQRPVKSSDGEECLTGSVWSGRIFRQFRCQSLIIRESFRSNKKPTLIGRFQ